MRRRTAVVYGDHLQAYNTSDDAERPLRRALAMGLLEALGLLDAPGMRVVDPPAATLAEIEAVHAPAYTRAVRRYGAEPWRAAEWEAAQWGFVPGQDTVAREGMHEAAAAVCGASLTGARLIWGGEADRAFCPAPAGLHHALVNRASGFCVYNDCAVAIRGLLDAGVERVAYVDLDAHHGDGVQWIFYADPRVFVASVHEKAPRFYPGTGGAEERGTGAGLGATLNVPLPPFAGDDAFLPAVEDVVIPAVQAFRPEILVTHLGVDVHHADPLTHLQVTTHALERAYRALGALADEACGGRWLDLAGGGYNIDTLGRLWALQLAALAGVVIGDDVPAVWLREARSVAGRDFTARLRDDPAPAPRPGG